MKNILLPTDLTLASLYPVHEMCQRAAGHQCNIRIIHTLTTPTGIADLLFLQQRKPYDKVSPHFMEALELLRKKYASVINILSFEFLWGSSLPYLNFYMDSRDIHYVYLLKDHTYEKGLPQSIDCLPALRKGKVPLIYVDKASPREFGTLTTLLYKEKMPA